VRRSGYSIHFLFRRFCTRNTNVLGESVVVDKRVTCSRNILAFISLDSARARVAERFFTQERERERGRGRGGEGGGAEVEVCV
jgi:hypothetical protein